MRTSIRTLAVVLVAVLIAGCGSGGSSSIATVNDTSISRELVERSVLAQLGDQNITDDAQRRQAEQDILRSTLQSLIMIEIIRDLTASVGIEITDAQIDATLDEQIALAGDEASFTGFLGSIGLTRDEYRNLIAADVTRRTALLDRFPVEIDDDAVRAEYERAYEDEVVARHLLVDTEEEARAAIGRIEGGEDFADVASEVSTDTGSAVQGGDLGASVPSRYVAEFAEAVRTGGIGELLGPVQTQFGFHVIEITERIENADRPAYADVEDELRQRLREQAPPSAELEEAYRMTIARAEVTFDASIGTWDGFQGRIIPPGGDAGGGGGVTEEEMQRMLEELLQEQEADGAGGS